MDGLLLRAGLGELQHAAGGARVETVHMPQPDTITIGFYKPGLGRSLMLVRCHPKFGRLQITEQRPQNPQRPPDFCMLLRKHLKTARLTTVQQHGYDRAVLLTFETANSSGSDRPVQLAIELTGAQANVALIAGGKIYGVLRPGVAAGQNRTLAPGVPYQPPATTPQLQPDTMSPADIRTALAAAIDTNPNLPTWRLVMRAVQGFGPAAGREVSLRAAINPDEPCGELSVQAVDSIVEELHRIGRQVTAEQFVPCAVLDANGDFAGVGGIALNATAAAVQGQAKVFPSVAALCDEVYAARESQTEQGAAQQRLLSMIKRQLQKIELRLAATEADLARSDDAVFFRQCGELLLAFGQDAPRGADHVLVPNVYAAESDHGGQPNMIRITLDPSLGVTANAERYFRRAQRLERTKAAAGRRRDQVLQQLQHVQLLAATVEQTDDPDLLAAIENELRETGYAAPGPTRQPKTKKRRQRRPERQAPKVLQLHSRDGWLLFVGRSGRQNLQVTFELAAPGDWWFHVKDWAGSHVIARHPQADPTAHIPDTTVEDAAKVAAYFSAARHSSNVPVDFTQRRHVRRIAGAPPGAVTYTDYRTVFVTPAIDQLPRTPMAERTDRHQG